MSSRTLHMVPRVSFRESATRSLEDLWAGLHGGTCPGHVRSLLSTMLEPWGRTPIPEVPPWPSDIGNDHSPFEFSAVVTPGCEELRIVVEAQGDGGFAATCHANLRLNESLARLGADFGRFERVRDLFLPQVPDARFALWHSVALESGPLRAKAYLNPQISGVDRTGSLVKAALERLEMPDAWSTLLGALRACRSRGQEIRYFALDLDGSAAARVKVYIYPKDATVRDLEWLAALSPGYVPGEVTEFCRVITRSPGPCFSHPPSVYLAFRGNDPTPSDVTIQIPIGYYAASDRIARDRVREYLRLRGLDTSLYDCALDAAATRPLDARSGLHTYVSLRTGTVPARVTTYFAAELYEIQAPPRRSSFPRTAHGSVAAS